MRPAESPALAREWRTWLEELDFAPRAEKGIHDQDPAFRQAAAELLPEFEEARRRIGEIAPPPPDPEPAMDRVAWEALSDPATFDPAARYFAFFRPGALDEPSLLAMLDADAAPCRRLLGLVLRARRGGAVDISTARELWQRLDPGERIRLGWYRTFIPQIVES
jgi:hypothetical protein